MYHTNPEINALMKRGHLFLEDQDWQNARIYFDRSLDKDPENAKAYIGMLLAEGHLRTEKDLYTADPAFAEKEHFKKAMRFADEEYRKVLEACHNQNLYFHAIERIEQAQGEEDYRVAAQLLAKIPSYQDADEKRTYCLKQAEQIRIDTTVAAAEQLLDSAEVSDIEKAKELLETINEHEKYEALQSQCNEKIETILKEKQAKKKKLVMIGIIGFVLVLVFFGITSAKQNAANEAKEQAIYQNFLGETFRGSISNDDGFYYGYTNNSLNTNQIYWKNEEEVTLNFYEDGRVACEHIFSNVALAYPSYMSEPDDYYDRSYTTYDSFDVTVASNGQVFLKLGSSNYSVEITEDNEPSKIQYDEGLSLW